MTFPDTWPPAGGEGVETSDAGTPRSLQLARVARSDLSDDTLAQEFGATNDGVLRYEPATNRWRIFDGAVWRVDEKREHMTMCRTFLREIAEHVGDSSKAKRLRSSAKNAAVLELTKSNEEQASTIDEWDADPYLLGTPAGTVDLRTGATRDSDPNDLITKATACRPAPAGTEPTRFLEVLSRAMAGDGEMVAYIQRWFGYMLTGEIREHAVLFAFGSGANSKSVIMNTIRDILGGYAVVIPAEMLMQRPFPKHETELARLMGARLAYANETEPGARLAESKLKSLTGGDPIAARFMRQDFFEFDPVFKLVVVGNHQPRVRAVDEAIRRRLHLVPFGVTIPREERDPHLPEKLETEWPAILRWMIDGCLEWQRLGLAPPESVRRATDDYLDEQDRVSEWMRDVAERDPDSFEPQKALYTSYRRWAEEGGESAMPLRAFKQELEKLGLEQKRTSMARGWTGLRLRNEGG